MKKTLFILLICSIFTTNAQHTIKNPTFKYRLGSIINITRIEQTPDTTRLYIHAIFKPNFWIKTGKNLRLIDPATNKSYYILGSEGFELEKENFMPESGTMDFVFLFPPLPKETKEVHLVDGEKDEFNTYHISLEKKTKKKTTFEQFTGNWFGTDNHYQWALGLYDSIAIVDNTIYHYQTIKQKGKTVLLTLNNDTQQSISLKLTLQKNGECLMVKNQEPAQRMARQNSTLKAPAKRADEGPVFDCNTIKVQGYIEHYNRLLGFENGIIYVSNELTNENYPVVVNIKPNGQFDCTFNACYPMTSSIMFNNAWIPFYAKPGQTVTIYLDWEAVMERARQRDYISTPNNLHYMGSNAHLSMAINQINGQINVPYYELQKMQKTLTPQQFKEQQQPMFDQWNRAADSIIAAHAYQGTDARIIQNTPKITAGEFMLSYILDRRYMALQEPENTVLQVGEEPSFYHFLKQMPLDDSLIVANRKFGSFINRLEFCNLARAAGDTTTVESNENITMTYPDKSLLAFLKEQGIELTAEEEALRLKIEERSGKTVTLPLSTLIKESKIWEPIHKKHKAIIEKFQQELKKEKPQTAEEKEPSNKEHDKAEWHYNNNKRDIEHLDTVVGHRTWVAQIMALRSFLFFLENNSAEGSNHLLNLSKTLITHPFMQTEAQRLVDTAFPPSADTTYALPEGKGTDIIRKILQPHAGKVLFIDFWATTCGPCRSNIEQTADLRKEYKNHPQFEFIFITSDRDSPEKSYNEYVEKNLKGEATYRISQTDYNHLRQLFRFNGIPHYELIEKDGTVLRKTPSSEMLPSFLTKRFGPQP